MVTATEDHPFWVRKKGWTPLKNISIGDKVAVKPQQTPYNEEFDETVLLDEKKIRNILPSTIDRTKLFSKLKKLSLLRLTSKNKKLAILARLLGHIFGDGTLHPAYENPEGQHSLRITFAGKRSELLEIQKDLEALGFPNRQKITEEFKISSCNFQKYGIKTIKGKSTYFKTGIVALWALLRALGAPVGSKSKNEVKIPRWLIKAPISIKREFLAAYFGSEAQKIRMGIKSAERIIIPLSKNEHLADNAEDFCNDIKLLLSEFRVEANIYQRQYTISKNNIKSIQYYITIQRFRKNIINFCKNIGYRYSPEREAQARLVLGYQEMLQTALNKKIALWKKSKKSDNPKELSKKIGVSIEYAKSLLRTKKMVKLSTKNVPSFKKWVKKATAGLRDGLIWETVESKYAVDVADVRDISVSKYHAFFANGFLTHNCNTHIILRITNPNDLDHIQMSSEGIDSRVARSITGLKVGEAIIVGEAVNYPTFVKIRRRKSEKREKGKALHLQAVDFENAKEQKEEGVEAFL